MRPLDPGYSTRLGSALDALSTRGAQSERLLHVLAHAGGAGPITLGYVAETPVWRTTYRLVLDADGAGSRRAPGRGPCSTTTPTRTGTASASSSRTAAPTRSSSRSRPRGTRAAAARHPRRPARDGAAADGHHRRRHLGRPARRLLRRGRPRRVSGVGEGGGGQRRGHRPREESAPSGTARAPGAARCSTSATSPAPRRAAGVESGALFVYTLPGPVDLRAHDSTLVPFAQQRVDATAIALVRLARVPPPAAPCASSTPRRRRCPRGTIAFFADGGFAGESALARLKPGERRFMTYGGGPRRRAAERGRRRVGGAEAPRVGEGHAAPRGALPPDERLHLRHREPERAPALGHPGHVARPQRHAHRAGRRRLRRGVVAAPRGLRRRAAQEPSSARPTPSRGSCGRRRSRR